jgi:hypothetical protein
MMILQVSTNPAKDNNALPIVPDRPNPNIANKIYEAGQRQLHNSNIQILIAINTLESIVYFLIIMFIQLNQYSLVF